VNAYRTFDARVRAAARAATTSDRLLLLAEDLAVAVLSPGRFPKGNLTADERRAFLVEKLLDGALGRRLRLTRALLFLGAGYDPAAPGVFFLPVAARRVERPADARVPRGPRSRMAARYAALYAVVHRKKRRGGGRVREELMWTVLRCPSSPAPDGGGQTARSDWGSPELALAVYYG
jgi:hypothetical protein